MKKITFFAIGALAQITSACAGLPSASEYTHPFIANSYMYIGYNEKTHRKELKEFLNVDPVITPWCAAFMNAVLIKSGYWGSEVMDPETSLLARSFLEYGEQVLPNDLTQGDIIVFPRQDGEEWQGHVGFFLEKRQRYGETYVLIISGNDNDQVTIGEKPLSTAIGFRRFTVLD